MLRKTIKRKLTMAIMGTSVTVLALTCTVFITYEVVTYRKNLAQALRTRAQIIAANSTAALAFQNEKDATEVLSAFKKDPHIVAACLYDNAGRVFAKFPPDAATGTFPTVREKQGYHFGKNFCDIFVPVVQQNRRLGTVYLKTDLSALTERYRFYTLLVLVVVATSVLVAFILSTWLQRRLAGPILELTDTARSVSEQKDYALRARKLSDDEIGLLTDSFNDMLSEIQRREQEIRQLNSELEQRVIERTAQLEASNKELEAFSYSVSHDLRAPLRGIDGFSKALLEDYGDKLDKEGRRHLGRVRSAAQRMAVLIDSLLNLSRIGRMEMKCESVNLSALAGQIAAELKQSQPERPVSFEIAEGLESEGDAQLLRIVLDNLLRNAWKYTSKHPTAKIEFASARNNGERIYFVRDDGAGFDMAHSDLLFAPFQRLHRQSDFEGTGVGLATAQRIIRRHGGRLWAEGAVEHGATFYFTLQERKNA